MKILFIENRDKTFFWDAIAEQLSEAGNEIFWIVQNKGYIPKIGTVILLDYPNQGVTHNPELSEFLMLIRERDRAFNCFKKKDNGHYFYYWMEIEKRILDIKPDIIFGEATAFHELITIEISKRHNIMYLRPESIRYPTGRFSFFLFDSLDIFRGSDEVADSVAIRDLLNGIEKWEVKADYMKIINKTAKEKLSRLSQVWYSYLSGERYNTPSLKVKFLLELERSRIKKKWEKAVQIKSGNVNFKDRSKFYILYPLQLQPEANLDVYCTKYRNQKLTLMKLLEHTDKNTLIIVKPNPKFKYEITNDLIKLIEENERLIPLSSSIKMPDIIELINLVVTCTGTIAYEASLLNRPVITLQKYIPNYNKNCKFLNDISELTSIIDQIRQKSYPIISIEEKESFIKYLYSRSYLGRISDPFSDPNVLEYANVMNVTNAFLNVLIRKV